MSPFRCQTLCGCALALLLYTGHIGAQEASRDPTVAPPETGVSNASPAGTEGMTVLVRDDKPYLVVASRLYAPGDTVGNMRVERITEKEVWFHDGSALIKVPRFAGIERKSIVAKPLCAAAAEQPTERVATKPSTKKTRVSKTRAKRSSPASATASPPAVAPCEDAQP